MIGRLWLALLMFSLILGGVFLWSADRSYSSNLGWYQRGRISIMVDKIDSFRGYEKVAIHEYAHHYWAKYLLKDQLKEWSALVKAQGFQSTYNFATVKTYSYKVQEEFAECVAMEYIKETGCSSDKRSFIGHLGILN